MSTTVHLPAHPWASAHRALLAVLVITLAVAVAVAIALVVSRVTADTPTFVPAGPPQTDTCFHAPAGIAC